MEVLGAVSTVVGLADVIEKRLVEFRVRLDRIRQHPDQYATLVATHDRIGSKLKLLRASLSEKPDEEVSNDMHLIQTHVNAAHSELDTLGEFLDVSSVEQISQTPNPSRRRKRITNAFSKLTAKGKALQRTTRNEETLASVQHHLDCAWRVLNEIRLIRIEQGVDAITHVERDVFVSTIVIRPNPENLVLDFESKDEHGVAVTCEGKLKQALFGAHGSCVGVIDGGVAGAVGGGGMGKSCAVRALASLKEVRETFRDGIYEISLGMDAGELTLKKELCNCVERSGGVILAKQMMSERSMQDVIRKAEAWFADKTVLFIVDDVWENEEITRKLFFSLRQLLGPGGSRMVFTSRNSAMKSSSPNSVEFGLRGPFSSISKSMLLEKAVMKNDDVRVIRNTASFREVLKICGGLPVALAVAGQLVREHGRDFDDPFGEVLSRIECHAGEVQNYDILGYGALSDLLDTAVEFCERRHGSEWQRRTGKSFEDIVLSLCVLQKQQFGPVSMLRRLWGLESEISARDLLKILQNVGLVKEEVAREKYGQVVGIRLHDLVHSHFFTKAKGKTSTFHKQLLIGYMEKGTDVMCRSWWEVDERKDNYLYLNLRRHLIFAHMWKEALRLFLDPRWTVKQFRVNGEAEIINDHLLFLIGMRRSNASLDRPNEWLKGVIHGVELINEAATLAAPYVIRNEREIWFQLYGRLLQAKNVSVRRYLKLIELYAERPWLKAAGRCVSQAGGLIQRIWTVDDDAFSIVHASIRQDGVVHVLGRIDSSESESYEVWRFERRCQQNQELVWGVKHGQRAIHSFASNDGSKVCFVLEDGRLEVWNVEKSKKLRFDVAEDDAPDFGRFSADGSLCALVWNGTDISIWLTDDEDAVEVCLLANQSAVSAVCWSVDGKSLAAGCKDGHVMLWDVGSELVKHKFDVGRGNEIDQVAWSPDERLLATSIAKKGMSVWDVSFARGKVPIQVFQMQALCGCMKWSSDGVHLAIATSSSANESAARVVNVWEMPTPPGIARKVDTVKCMKRISCVNWSEDGKKLVVGDESRTVRVARPLSVDAGAVSVDTEKGPWACARWCQNGTILAALRDRGGVYIWRQREGRRTAEREAWYEFDRWAGSAKDLACAAEGELLAAVYVDEVVVWNIRTKDKVCVLDSDKYLTSGALSQDGSVFAATSFRQLLVWRIDEQSAARTAHTGVEVRCVAVSHDGRFVCGLRDEDVVVVWQLDDDALTVRATTWCRQFLGEGRRIRSLCFDEKHEVLIEWEMREEDMGGGGGGGDDVAQFSRWQWQLGGEARDEARKRRACVVGNKTMFDAQRRCVATFEDNFVQWQYSEHSGALAMVAEDGRLVTCYLQE